ncbi:MAG TPA: universal stress protein [Candidatus Angelobacter sp.]|nr:universal stress protein [Candidatus Angelobacter sp.]
MATLAAHAFPAPVAGLKNILFATDFSEASMKAFPYVAELSRHFGASVFACHIIIPTSLVAAAPQAAPSLYEAEYDAATTELDNILASPQLKGLKTKPLLSSGILGDSLLEEITENNVDLVIAGTHGRTGLRRFLLGSAVEEICRVATCPVLTIGPDCPTASIKINRILVPTDLSDDSMRALPFVMKLAASYGASVIVLHVLPEETASNPDAIKLSEPVRRSMVHTFESRLTPLKAEFLIESGPVAETILKIAREKTVDVIAMGIRNAFLPGFHLRSSVAYRVMTAAHCPVVTCR